MWSRNGGFVAMGDAVHKSYMMCYEGRRPAASLEISNISRRGVAFVIKRVSIQKLKWVTGSGLGKGRSSIFRYRRYLKDHRGGALVDLVPAMGGHAVVEEDDSLVGHTARPSWKHWNATGCGTDSSPLMKSNRLFCGFLAECAMIFALTFGFGYMTATWLLKVETVWTDFEWKFRSGKRLQFIRV